MKVGDLKAYIPEIMRIMRALMLILLVFEYPIAGKCLLLLVFVEITVGKGRYNRGLAIFVNVILLYITIFSGDGYIKANLCIYACMVALCIQLVMKLWALALEKVDFIKNSERFTRYINIKVRYIILVVVVFVGAVFTLSVTPYDDIPEVSEGYKATFEVDKFYSDKVSCDRAAVIDDNGEALGQRIKLIENAKNDIIMSTFSFQSDTSGKQMLAALMNAAERGVNIKIILDGFNSVIDIEGNPYFMVLAQKENVEIEIYNEASVFASWKGMSRMHDKYIIADDEVYILGGRNTFDYFLGDQPGYKNYDRDVLVYNTGGTESSVYDLKTYFYEVWLYEACEEWDAYIISSLLPSVHSAERELAEVYRTMKEEHAEWFEKPDYMSMTVQTDKITLLSNPIDIYMKEPWVLYGLSQLMENAENEVVIHTPYIIADEYMYEVLRNACDNASVKLVTNAAENNGNLFGAVDYILHKQEILETGVKVLEYEGGVSYHAKSMTIDDDISIIGSFNMDYKSAYHDTELMLVVDGEEFNERLKASHFIYEKETRVAEVIENELEIVLNSKSFGKMLQGVFIRILDPHFRHLF